MNKTIVLGSLFFCVLSTLSYTQSTKENKSEDSLKSITQQKQPLTPKDYKLWMSLLSQRISSNGDWYSYTLFNEYDKSYKLTVSSIKKDISYSFQSPTDSDFSPGGGWFGCSIPDRGMGLLNLEKGTIKWMSLTDTFEFSDDDRYLIGHIKSTDTQKVAGLRIVNLANMKEEWIPGVTEYLLDPSSNSLIYITDTKGKKAVISRTLEPSSTDNLIAENSIYNYKKLVWNGEKNKLVFLQEMPKEGENPNGYKLYHYSSERGHFKLCGLDLALLAPQLTDTYLTDTFLEISADGSAVFFKVQNREDIKKTLGNPFSDDVQVWRAKDKKIYRERESKSNRRLEYGPKLAAWWPIKERAVLLETDSLPEAFLTGDRKHLLSYNPTEYAPHFELNGDIDLYLTDFETRESFLFLREHENDRGHTMVSPDGKYIAYFRDRHWWIYDIEKRTHTNVTKDLEVPVYEVEYDRSGAFQPYGAPGWTERDKRMIIYDRYDVWLLSPNGKAPRRLTRGRESRIRHRIYFNAYRELHHHWFPMFEGEVFKLSEGLVFETLGSDMASGYSLWKQERGLKELVHKDMRIKGLKKARNQEAYIYTEQSFAISPRIRYWEPGMRDGRLLVETNTQQERFHWGHSELIQYPGPDGKPLQGALYYPANYTPEKKYPMVVHVYERQSYKLHRYTNPSEFLQDGWNPTNYTADGYMVFYPDIRYTFNDLGKSAVRCVETGVRAVLSKGLVAYDRIGLIGHSFGGYETAFIVTQTDLFAAAVVGAGVTNLVSSYHTVNGNLNRDKINFFEDGIYRFRDSFYENPEAYIRNSPLHHAADINTPLLLWTGEEDYHVHWRQSIELYLGLRRLGKTCELLIYPGEAHTMWKKPKNQIDLTKRIKQWFRKYLKEGAEDGTE